MIDYIFKKKIMINILLYKTKTIITLRLFYVIMKLAKYCFIIM